MKHERTINVSTLDMPHRRALEEVIGQQLLATQQLLISIVDVESRATEDRPPQTLDDWTGVYDGLNEDEIEEIDAFVKTRADLTRDVP